MKRQEFIRNCAVLTLSGSLAASFLEACSALAYAAKHEYKNGIISIAKTEFTGGDVSKKPLKFILIRDAAFAFPICVYKIDETHYSAVYTECTHKGCELKPQRDFLVCPCHGSEFSRTGEVQNPPAELPLKSYKTSSDEKYIYIHI